MGQAKIRKAQLGRLYGTPEGSNRPVITAAPLQTAADSIAELGILHVASERAGSDCCDIASSVQERFPHLRLQAGIILIRGASHMPGHNGRICWDSPFQGHCWLVDKGGTIFDPSLRQTLDTVASTPPPLVPIRPFEEVQARLLPVAQSTKEQEEVSRLIQSMIDRDPINPITDGADILYIPGALDGRYLHQLSNGDGIWEVMAQWTRHKGGFTTAHLQAFDRWTLQLTDDELREMNIRTRDYENFVGVVQTITEEVAR